MTKADEILKELQNGTPLEKIRRKYNDPKAALYEAFNKYFPVVGREIEQKRLELGSLNSKVMDLNTKLNSLEFSQQYRNKLLKN